MVEGNNTPSDQSEFIESHTGLSSGPDLPDSAAEHEKPDAYHDLGGHEVPMTPGVARALLNAGLPGPRQEAVLRDEEKRQVSGAPKPKEATEAAIPAADKSLLSKGFSPEQIDALRRARREHFERNPHVK